MMPPNWISRAAQFVQSDPCPLMPKIAILPPLGKTIRECSCQTKAPAVMPGNSLNGMTTVTKFPLYLLCLLSPLSGCSTHSEFFTAESQRHLAAQAPIFTCDKCEGVTLRSQIPSAPTVAPTNGWDALSSVGKSISSVVAGQAGTLLAGYAINALASNQSPMPASPGPITTTTTTTTTGDTISTYQANQSTESTVTTSSTSNALDNSGQIAGGDASVANSYNPHTETATSTTNNSHNPVYTTTNTDLEIP